MIDSFVTLMMGAIDGARNERRRYFEKFIDPVYQQFVEVHEGFLRSFESYRSQALNPEYSLDLNHPLLAEVIKDSRLTQHKRDQLVALGSVEDKVSGDFYKAICSHLLNTYVSIDDSSATYFSNAPRSNLIKVFQIVLDGETITLATVIQHYLNQLKAGFIILPSCQPLRFDMDKYKNVNEDSIKMAIDDLKRNIIISAINEIVDQMQIRFSLASNEYLQLRDQFYR